MKQTPEYDKIQENMRKGVITLDGFLGDDTRKLVDIIAEDTFAIHAHHTTKEAIASRMEYFRKQVITYTLWLTSMQVLAVRMIYS